MLESLRNRLILIAVLLGVSVFVLWPRVFDVQKPVNGVLTTVPERRLPLRLGLDLVGGIHLAVEIDESGGAVPNRADALDRVETIIRNRIDELGVAEPLVQRVGEDRVIVELPGLRDFDQARSVVRRAAFLEFRIVDVDNQFADALPAIDRALFDAGVRLTEGSAITPEADSDVQALLGTDTTRGPADTTGGATEPDSAGAGAGATIEDPRSPVFSTHLFREPNSVPGEFQVPAEAYDLVDSLIRLPAFGRALPRGLAVFWSNDTLSVGGRGFRGLYAVESSSIITGEFLSDAQATIDPAFNSSVVTFSLTRRGGRIFERATGEHIGDHMAILLDETVQGRPPIIQGQIGRRGQIDLGSATIGQANELALVLRAGALPAPVEIVEERTVGASLGADSIAQGRTAGLVGIVIVVLVIIAYYRKSGLIAFGALGVYVTFALAGLVLLDATLTLPGLAGLVLSLGLAVDANVLIFERIREEIKVGKTPRLAIENGFHDAMPAIIDANVTTVITASFLYMIGTGPVRGFAITLIVGIIASLITAVFVTHTFFLVWLQRRSPQAELSI